ncbi:MAG: Rieske (2Fe-2S) protein, partial [bacterium]|nr:Rieske (2Fe-2S) protein [bacterium]
MKKVPVATLSELEDRKPAYALVANVDLVIVRYAGNVSVLYGRCLHRGALMSDGTIHGKDIVCGVHGWDYQFESGVSAYNNEERLPKFNAWIEN